MRMKNVVVIGGFDDTRSRHVRFLHEASKVGRLRVLLWTDEVITAQTGTAPKFSEAERVYFLDAVRYVDEVTLVDEVEPDKLPREQAGWSDIWVVEEAEANARKRAFCEASGLEMVVLRAQDLTGFPVLSCPDAPSPRPKVIVTGCYDWLHSGHIRFFEETSGLGDLYVVAGSDANVRLLKGAGHPLFPEDERRYMVQSIRFVKQALISSGQGWMDAEPEIAVIKPDIYAVNEDGDVPEKRAFCKEQGIEYMVLKRLPKEGLTKRQSTDLRGF
jgi:cytidyltransferase-like protein